MELIKWKFKAKDTIFISNKDSFETERLKYQKIYQLEDYEILEPKPKAEFKKIIKEPAPKIKKTTKRVNKKTTKRVNKKHTKKS